MTKSVARKADVRLVRIEDGQLEIATRAEGAAHSLITDLPRKLELWTGRRWTVIISNEAGAAHGAFAERIGATERASSARPRPIRACRM